MATSLRAVEPADLEAFYAHQADVDAAASAAFRPRARPDFMRHWHEKVLGDAGVIVRTVLEHGTVAGNVCAFQEEERWLVGYWIGREHWGRGVATRALQQFVALVPARPLHAIVAAGNAGSIRVLQKCGFARTGTLPTRDDGTEEWLFALTAANFAPP